MYIPSDEFDKDFFKTYYANDLNHLKVVFESFLESIDKELIALEAAYQTNNFELIGEIAHKIKPNFAFVGFSQIANLYQEVENLAYNHELDQKINMYYPDLIKQAGYAKEIITRELARIKLMEM